MNNIRLSVKLIGGFLLTTLIIICVGGLSIFEQRELSRKTEELGTKAAPAMEAIMTIQSDVQRIMVIMRTQLNPYITNDQRDKYFQQLFETRKHYAMAKDRFASLPLIDQVNDEWKNFLTSLNSLVNVNNQTIDIIKNLMVNDLTNPTRIKQHINDFEIAHIAALVKTTKLLYYNIPFDGAIDPENCVLGKWLKNQDTKNPQIDKIIQGLLPIHKQFHENIAQIKTLTTNGQLEQARDIAGKELFTNSEKIMVAFHEMGKIADSANDQFAKMSRLQLENGEEFQNAMNVAIAAMVHKSEQLVSAQVKDAMNLSRRGMIITIVCLAIGILFALSAGAFLTRQITKPLFKGVDFAKAMAAGDLTKTIDITQKDETGDLALALNHMAISLRNMFGDIGKEVLKMNESSAQLAAVANQMTTNTSSSAILSHQVAAAAEEMSSNQVSIASAMEQTSINVKMVATSAEELNSTIHQIAQNSERAKEITSKAVTRAQNASERVNDLGKAADLINKVTETITEISEQTNLLALNATIEAARAGEAGKGFAVVANEIKDLAKQTASATLDIKTKIHSIQHATGVTVKEINDISMVIIEVDKIVTLIATAVEEQSATTKEIAENVHQASLGISEVSENVAQSSTVSTEIASDIATVNKSVNEISDASGQVKANAEELASTAKQLRAMTTKFTI